MLPRETTDGTYRSSNTEATPSDLVVLDLGSGIVDPIPNLELAPNETPPSCSSPRTVNIC